MKIKLTVFLTMMICSVLISCSKKKDDPIPATTPTYVMTATVNGSSFNATASAAAYSSIISFSGGTTSGKSINLNLPTNATVGTYTLGTLFGSAYSAAYYDGNVFFNTQTGTGSGSGTLTITDIAINSSDGHLTKLKGTFSFNGFDSSSNQATVANGVVNF